MQGKKVYQEKFFTDFKLSQRVPEITSVLSGTT
jgi:hypothetical protein